MKNKKALFRIITLIVVIVFVFTTCEVENSMTGELIFQDDFNGTSLDKTKWDLCPNWDRQGRSTWTDDMVSVSDGLLHLKFKRDTTLGAQKTSDSTFSNNWIRAGGVRTRKKESPYNIIFENSYGYYEAKIKFPVVSGTWGAFWLMSRTQEPSQNAGKDGTEIDIVETIHNETGEYNSALHWNGYGAQHESVGSKEYGGSKTVNIYDGNFHIFAIEWSSKEYIFYIDDIEFWRVNGGASFKNCGINQTPNYIKLTVEGADWAGTLPADFTEAEMLVDYVRVYNLPKPKP